MSDFLFPTTKHGLYSNHRLYPSVSVMKIAYPVTTQYPPFFRVSCRPSTKKGGIYLKKPSFLKKKKTLKKSGYSFRLVSLQPTKEDTQQKQTQTHTHTHTMAAAESYRRNLRFHRLKAVKEQQPARSREFFDRRSILGCSIRQVSEQLTISGILG